MSSVPQSSKIALTRIASQACAVALALGAVTVISFAQTQGGKPAPAATATETSAPHTNSDEANRASAYYHYMLAHEYEDMLQVSGVK